MDNREFVVSQSHLSFAALCSEYGTESEEEMYDDEYASPESPLAQEQYYHRQPKLRGRAHGARHKHISHLELGEKCKSYSSGRDSFKHVAGNAMQSSGYREYCHPSGRSSHSLPARRSSYIPNGAGKGHQMCTGCDGFIGSAAQVCPPYFVHLPPLLNLCSDKDKATVHL